jgi:hypothetical protein
MNDQQIETNIDQIRELCRDTLRALRSASEASRYGAALDHAIARRQLCIRVYDDWFASLSTRAKKVVRGAIGFDDWNGDGLSRMSRWDVAFQANCGKTTREEIFGSLSALGIEIPNTWGGSVVVQMPPTQP